MTNHYEIRRIRVFLPFKAPRVAKGNRTQGVTHSCEPFTTRPRPLEERQAKDLERKRIWLRVVTCSSKKSKQSKLGKVDTYLSIKYALGPIEIDILNPFRVVLTGPIWA
ncbi:hypothetical protein YC2023_043440 [Brassica napus]